jgi:hypothetical protein
MQIFKFEPETQDPGPENLAKKSIRGILMSLHGDMLRHARHMGSHFGRKDLSPH